MEKPSPKWQNSPAESLIIRRWRGKWTDGNLIEKVTNGKEGTCLGGTLKLTIVMDSYRVSHQFVQMG